SIAEVSFFFFSSRRRHTRSDRDWSSDVCSSDLKGFKATDSAVSVFYGCRATTFCLGLREKYWREHVRDMLTGIDGHSSPCLLLRSEERRVGKECRSRWSADH